MTISAFDSPISLDQFRQDAAGIPGVNIRISRMPELLARFCHHPPAPGYEIKPAEHFCPEDFSLPFLSPGELIRLNKFKVLKKQVEWACGRFLVKSLVREVLAPQKELDQISIGTKPQGAPFLEDFSDYSLTLSHSNNLTVTALAVTPGPVLGIDLERVGPMPDKAFMTTAFTPKEIKAMAPNPQAVFQCWTLKEAYLKFIGKGFHESLHHVQILGNAIYYQEEKQPVITKSWLLDSGYAAGLVFSNTL